MVCVRLNPVKRMSRRSIIGSHERTGRHRPHADAAALRDGQSARPRARLRAARRRAPRAVGLPRRVPRVCRGPHQRDRARRGIAFEGTSLPHRPSRRRAARLQRVDARSVRGRDAGRPPVWARVVGHESRGGGNAACFQKYFKKDIQHPRNRARADGGGGGRVHRLLPPGADAAARKRGGDDRGRAHFELSVRRPQGLAQVLRRVPRDLGAWLDAGARGECDLQGGAGGVEAGGVRLRPAGAPGDGSADDERGDLRGRARRQHGARRGQHRRGYPHAARDGPPGPARQNRQASGRRSQARRVLRHAGGVDLPRRRMGARRVRDLQAPSRQAARAAHRDVQHRRGQPAEGVSRRADRGARPGRAAARAPDRRVLQHGAHPPVGGPLRGDHSPVVRNLRTLPALLLALVATASPAQGVIRIVAPFAAGGVQDVLARSFNAELGTLLGRSVIVENRTGAGGTIGNASVAKAPPDGHMLLLAAASHTITGSLYAKLPYHPIDDFTGVAHLGSVDYVLMASAEVPAKNLKEFIAYSKSNPGKLNYASAGNGSATHLSMAYLASLTGLDLVHVPLKSTAEAINEVIAGRAHAVIASNIGALPFAKDPRVRMLGVTGSKRSRFLAELPREDFVKMARVVRISGARID